MSQAISPNAILFAEYGAGTLSRRMSLALFPRHQGAVPGQLLLRWPPEERTVLVPWLALPSG